MTEAEVRPYIGSPVRLTLADGRMLAGMLVAEADHGHGHMHLAVVSDALREGAPQVRELLHGVGSIVEIVDASNDPAAVG